MQACLQDPEHGYYRRQPAIGRAGDFVTAPEISQVFGELVGLWCAVVWQQMGSPPAVRLIELGPGRGTLMRDALRAARLVPEFRAALHVELVESNAALEPVQRATLSGEGVPLRWSADILPGAGPAIVIANEFIDTLPVAQWVFRDGAWRARCVGLDAAGDLAFVDGARACQSATSCRHAGARRRRHLRGAHGGTRRLRRQARGARRAVGGALHRLRPHPAEPRRHAAGGAGASPY